MATDELSPEVRRFLDRCIDSIEQLQVLLLLNSQPDRTWSAAEITAELRSTESSIAKRLNDLYKRGVLERISEPPMPKDRHRFTPSTPTLRDIIRRLEEENRRRPFRIIEAIYARPQKALVAFSDAFKLGGDKP